MTCFQVVVNWLLTDAENNVPAIRLQKPPDVKHLGKSAVSTLRMMKVFMSSVENIAREKNVWPQVLSYSSINAMWVAVQPILIERYGKNGQVRIGELNWKTLYNQITKK